MKTLSTAAQAKVQASGHQDATNMDAKTVAGFGDEWSRFDQSKLAVCERITLFNRYFDIFPWQALPANAQGFDLGCGSGRWAQCVAPRVGMLHCIDPSVEALEVARKNLAGLPNCRLHVAGVDAIPLPDNSMDFGYCLGVLHHVPDTAKGIKACIDKLKPGAPFLIYLYYAFDNKPTWFRMIWKGSDIMRRFISRLPHGIRYWITQTAAACVYLPLARTARLIEKMGRNVDDFPLAAYRHLSFYSMQTDALDRLGTRLEQRFTAAEIRQMLEAAGLVNVTFSSNIPYWCAVGIKDREN